MIRPALLVIPLLLLSSPAYSVSAADERKAFLDSDKNADKVLSKREFRTFLRRMAKLGHKESRKAMLYGPAGVEEGFKRVDANKDGKLSPAELRKYNSE